MKETGSKTIMCSVLFLDIVEYSKRSVAGQISLKDRFNSYLSAAICNVPIADRIILDTGDGAAVNFLGDIEDALKTALSLRESFLNQPSDADPPLLVRMGINLGPVRLVMDINGRPNVVGDGVNVAQRIMGFAEPDQILLSRSYYEAVSHLSSRYTGMFHYEGSRTDKHVREHEVYAIGRSGDEAVQQTPGGNTDEPASNNPVEAPERGKPVLNDSGSLSGRFEPADARRHAIFIAAIALSVVLVGVLAFKFNRHDKPPAPPSVEPVQAVVKHAPPHAEDRAADASVIQPAGTAKPDTKPVGSKAGGKKKNDQDKPPNIKPDTRKHEPASKEMPIAAMGGSSKAHVTVSCQNDEALVFVDNVQKGKANFGVVNMEVSPGKHTVLARHASGIMYTQKIDLAAGNTAHIKPSFCD